VFAGVRRLPPLTSVAGHGPFRPGVNTETHIWKACWGKPLASSNLASSATLTGKNPAGCLNGRGLPMVANVVSFISYAVARGLTRTLWGS
jgi:hypothetical protein